MQVEELSTVTSHRWLKTGLYSVLIDQDAAGRSCQTNWPGAALAPPDSNWMTGSRRATMVMGVPSVLPQAGGGEVHSMVRGKDH